MTFKTTRLEIIQTPINNLILADYNSRKWSTNQKEQLKQSIKKFGVVDPILVNSAENRKNIIIGGHFRFTVLKELKFESVPVIYLNIPDLEKEKELNLRLNKNQGEFDFDLLSNFQQDFLSEIGFNKTELEEIYNLNTDTNNDEFNIQTELDLIKVPKSKLGDIYELGKHRLICGDSTDINVIKKLLGENKIDMVYCDPVYNIGLSYRNGIGGTKNYGGSATDNKTKKEYENFLSKTIENALSVCNKDAHFFYYCDQIYVPMIANLYESLGIRFRRICIWLKGIANPTPQVAFSKVYEPCVYGTIGKPHLSPNHRNYDEVINKDIGTGLAMIENVNHMYDVWLEKRLDGQSYEHPTEKPITLHDKPIKRCTKLNDNILSLFGGSGGDLIASEQLGRKCFMVELDPVFVDLIIRRYEKFTNSKVIKVN